jgi:hypothetical protein
VPFDPGEACRFGEKLGIGEIVKLLRCLVHTSGIASTFLQRSARPWTRDLASAQTRRPAPPSRPLQRPLATSIGLPGVAGIARQTV